MPTSIQSAPARCEFRGGIESYCKAASSVLSKNGIFVVCENWLNDDRVYQGAKDARLDILRVYPIKGNLKKQQNLFAVYVMKHSDCEKRSEERSDDCDYNDVGGNDDCGLKSSCTKVFPTISVRDNNGAWTEEYKKIMNEMAIP